MACKICREASNLKWRRAHPEWYLAESRKLRKQRVEPLMKIQKGLCAICKRYLKHPYEDHNHETGKRRGLLCPSCNGGLPLVEYLLKAAIKYLRKWKA
jgi:hypothetical protein